MNTNQQIPKEESLESTNKIPHNPFTGQEVRKPLEVLKDFIGFEPIPAQTIAKMYETYREDNAELSNPEHVRNCSEAHYLTELLTELFMSLENNPDSSHLGITHMTGQPIRTLNQLHRDLTRLDSFDYLVEQVSLIFNSYFNNDEGDNYNLAIKFKTLFIELMQNIECVDLDIVSKTTGNPVRTIEEIYEELINQATLSEHLTLLNGIIRKALYKEDKNEGISNYIAIEFYEAWTQIFINVHNGVVFIPEDEEPANIDSSERVSIYTFWTNGERKGKRCFVYDNKTPEQAQKGVLEIRNVTETACIRLLTNDGAKSARQFELNSNRIITLDDIPQEWIAEFEWFTFYDLDGNIQEDNTTQSAQNS